MAKTAMTGSLRGDNPKSEISNKTHADQPITVFPGGDNSSPQITAHKRNGKNYLQWSQSIKIVICSRGKFKYITGEAKAPAPTAPAYKKWFAESSIVHAWLINSMEPMISRRYLFLPTAKDVWDTARRTNSDLGNASQVFEIPSKLKEMKQGTKFVTQYFTDLQDSWQELDLFLEENSVCATCNVKQRQILEKERVYDFLAGLNRGLDEVRGHILSRLPFPTTEEAFAEVHREEKRWKVMLPEEGSPSAPTNRKLSFCN